MSASTGEPEAPSTGSPRGQAPSGFVVWLTGLPASGKTSLARVLVARLREEGLTCVQMDSDELRAILTPRATYSGEERDWFYSAVADLAAWLAASGIGVVIAATAHRRAYRERARHQVRRFAEVYVKCPPEVCRSRDTKGLYARADAYARSALPGVGVAYEAPLAAEAEVDTSVLRPDDAASEVLEQLRRQGCL